MIKCPNCERITWIVCEWHSKNFYHEIKAEYSCRCGCIFEVIFIPSTPRILNKEKG